MIRPERISLVLLFALPVATCGGSGPNGPTSSETRPLPQSDKGGPRPPLPDTPGPITLSGAWTGAVASTEVLQFGGPPYCFYTVQFTNLSSSIRIEGGRVSSAQVTATHTEEAIRGCPFTTGPPNTHTYTLNSGSVVGRRVSVRYDSAGSNYPTANLDFEGDMASDGRAIAGTLTLNRVDQPTAPNLQWRMAIALTMQGSTQ